ncbi:MAG: bacillithiol biosynthesis cysteine-adding enzyme BshC [Gemmatimonadetes bacterium]|nr:bacillithiol biosynthesis cysteine-adding enzyme BshC [Gemmatimonadota bacterium]NNM03514.1 bacillithiol biosynthesis cysteine-adding enzyme BshC [Gemmatimonadota bacterium]
MGDYIRDEPHACRFYGGSFRDPSSYREKAREVDARFHRDARQRALSMIGAHTEPARDRLDRFLEEGGFFVTTGQQPGLFTGPLYSLYKALTAIRLASSLEPLLERPVLAMFWIASEDHDWEEADHTHLLDVGNELQTLRVPEQKGALHRPLHRIPLHEGLVGVVDDFIGALPETDFSPGLFELIRGSYPTGQTLPGGFVEVMQEVLAELPIVFVDSADPMLKEASAPILFREMEEADEHEALLARVASHLELEGYHAQVPILEGGVNLFFEGEAGRDRLYRDGGAFRLNRAGTRMELEEIRSKAQEDPSLLSPNVLLRPVVESALFPTVSYVGGPGELAYFAQLKDLFRAHGLEMPVVHPRHSVTLVEAKIGKILGKFHRTPDSLDRPHHELAAEIALEEVPPEVRRALGEIRGTVGKSAGALTKAVQKIDPTLKGPISHARNAAFAAFDEAERKILQALKRENEIALDQLEKAQRHLFPFGKPQERSLNAFYYLSRYGPKLIPALLETFNVDLGMDIP